MSHALLAPSKAERWLNCPPSARLEQSIKEDDTSPFAYEGSQAHTLAEKKLKAYLLTGRIDDIECEDAEMQRYTDDYVAYVIGLYNEAPDAKLFVETRLSFTDIVPYGYGTADAVIIRDGTIDLIDLKYGRGVKVEAENNPQLQIYAIGAIKEWGDLYDIKQVRTHIYQPRLNHIEVAEYSTLELLEWGKLKVKPIAKLAYAGKGEYKAGHWCRFCKARQRCKARAEQVTDLEPKDPALLSAQELAELLPRLSELIKWANEVEDYSLKEALKGVKIPGYKVVESQSRKRLKDGFADYMAGRGFDQSVYMEAPKLKSMTALKKELGVPLFDEVTKDFIYRPAGKPTLAPDSDKRKEFATAQADFMEEIA